MDHAGIMDPVDAGSYDFNQGWLFGGEYTPGSAEPGYDDSGFTPVTLPHTAAKLSWADWDPASWQRVWIYRKHFGWARRERARVFVDFDGVLVNATVLLNGTVLSTHQGGYLPWSTELTGSLAEGDNVLAVIVDSRWLPVPPDGAPGGPAAIDFLEPGGIYRDATLRVVPEIFVSGVFARPAEVLTASRAVAITATIDAAAAAAGPVRVTAELLDTPPPRADSPGPARPTVLASATVPVTVAAAGATTADVSITGLPDITLWSPDTPRLYTVRTTLSSGDAALHTAATRIGFRDATFRPGGFYLNGERLKLFGLNRHQLFPYLGMAAPARLQRADAEMLRYQLNCNMVRCSHYPQSPHFLDACDEIGLMVWAEPPGWQYVGGAAWQDIVAANVADLVMRDRNRPSVIVWATRLNETGNYPELYARTRQLAHRLDGGRPTAGAVNRRSRTGWAEDVLGYNDYHSSRGRAKLKRPLAGIPYLVTEAVGALDGPPVYRWADSAATLAVQARMHAEVHEVARANPGYAGLLAWAGIDYASLNGGARVWRGLKTPGVTDTFRVPKPGAAFYRSQADPRICPVVLPVFFWDFGPGSPPGGPGRQAMIATNCDRLEIFVGPEHVATGIPDRKAFGSLRYPPVFTNLTVDGSGFPDSGLPELRIDGYLGGQRVATTRMSADTSRDRLWLAAGNSSIEADGSDATLVTFRAVDTYGNQRPHVTGSVALAVAGPASLIGDNPFPFDACGGVGGAVIRSQPGRAGQVLVSATHPALGRAEARITVTPPAPGRQFR
jgi:beta-galactosidase